MAGTCDIESQLEMMQCQQIAKYEAYIRYPKVFEKQFSFTMTIFYLFANNIESVASLFGLFMVLRVQTAGF